MQYWIINNIWNIFWKLPSFHGNNSFWRLIFLWLETSLAECSDYKSSKDAKFKKWQDTSNSSKWLSKPPMSVTKWLTGYASCALTSVIVFYRYWYDSNSIGPHIKSTVVSRLSNFLSNRFLRLSGTSLHFLAAMPFCRLFSIVVSYHYIVRASS